MKSFITVFMFSALLISAPSSAEQVSGPTVVLDKFRAALTEANTEVVKDVLADNVLIFEGGGVERSLAEYSSHHLMSDIKFSKAVSTKLLERTVQEADGLAVITSRYSVVGSYNDRKIDLTMNETVTVLNTTESGWKIIRIHWSN